MKKSLKLLMAVCALACFVNSPALAQIGDQDNAWMGEEASSAREREFLQSAVLRTATLDCRAARSTMILDMEGQADPLTVNLELKFKNRNSGDLKYLAVLRTVKEGAIKEDRLFYSDGYYCGDLAGRKGKLSMSLDQARADLAYDPYSMGLGDLDSIGKLQISDDGNGNQLCTFLCDVREMEDNNNDYFYNIYQAMDLIWADVEIKEMRGSFLVNQEGYCTEQTMDMTLDVTVYNKTANAHIKIDIVYINPGSQVDFALPSALDYTEYEDPNPRQCF